MSILKKKKKEDEEGDDELERILSQIKDEEEGARGAAVVTIQIAGLNDLVKAIRELVEAVKKCE
ncbi:hypothetical protein [Pyrobaculum calidifontis]|uniref:Uncharacterized protein n=1 Tax=Pyrobaculum calidifontis (strain DSM 21063 / JCM 11548 / VA1) TaxID=410359 RepID=A3MV83_PYRCJ|nr:hypothetical protein [Pyrobaculum calidifontis]ABO08550.1 hypothetical protein Pcal_1125 [Pyrobaculum calidifontis JCM 11548]